MGHRKHSAPRRGSLAFRPRGRAQRLLPKLSEWPEPPTDSVSLGGIAGFKAGMLHAISIDDRQRTPNFGKPLFNPATVIATPLVRVLGIRAYRRVAGELQAMTEAVAKEAPPDLERRLTTKPGDPDKRLAWLAEHLGEVAAFRALLYLRPRDAGLAQKAPLVFEMGVVGGDVAAQFAYLRELLGKEVGASALFKPGMYVDVAGITKGKGFEGPVTRFGVKRKQHKARKSVRALGTLGPWHPSTIMYTVPRAGQRGFHQRVEFNKRVLLVGDGGKAGITAPGGFKHFGLVRGEYLVLRGSVPGPVKRPIILRFPARPPTVKLEPPQITGLSVAPLAR